MRIHKFALGIFLIFCLTACAAMNTTPSQRALALTQQYQAMEDTYKSQYRAAGKQEQQWLKKSIAPVLDETRQAIQAYSKAVLAGDDATEKRLNVLRLLRKANQKLLEISNEAK